MRSASPLVNRGTGHSRLMSSSKGLDEQIKRIRCRRLQRNLSPANGRPAACFPDLALLPPAYEDELVIEQQVLEFRRHAEADRMRSEDQRMRLLPGRRLDSLTQRSAARRGSSPGSLAAGSAGHRRPGSRT